jgi:nitronate monooxygenase
MAGGPSTPELAAAVTDAGGLGTLAGAYLTPEQLREEGRHLRALTRGPFGANLFAGGYDAGVRGDVKPLLELLAETHATLGLPPPSVAPVPPDPFPAQLEAVLELRPALFSFTFGIPDAATLDRVRRAGILTAGTATSVEEARRLAEAGVDVVVAQGAEAGGNRGTFEGPPEASMTPTLALVAEIVRVVPLPVVATGGLMEGRDVARALAAGAAAAQLGTAFLACPESGASPAYKQAILRAHDDTTVVTRAFSGRPARGLRNAFITAAESRAGAVLPYPLQNAMTRAMRQAAAKQGRGVPLALGGPGRRARAGAARRRPRARARRRDGGRRVRPASGARRRSRRPGAAHAPAPRRRRVSSVRRRVRAGLPGEIAAPVRPART